MRVVLIGFPGAGKGTQGALLAKHYHIPWIATGDMFRAALASGSALGKEARSYMERGALVPDEITIGIVRERLSRPDCERGFILDGFPRTVAQAEALDAMLKEIARELHAVLYLSIPMELAVSRITQRLVCRDCGTPQPAGGAEAAGGRCPQCGGELVQRSDDTEETARRRLEVYEQETRPVVDYYAERGLLVEIDGTPPVDEVFANLRRHLEAFAPAEPPSAADKADSE